MQFTEIKLALRRLIKRSNHTAINLIGLTIGISTSFLIYLYVSDQMSYDSQIPNADNIYRVSADFRLNNHRDIYSNAPRPMGSALVEEYPGILEATKIMGYNGLQNHSGYVEFGEDYIHTEHFFAADSSFLKVFELSMLKGETYPLKNPNTAIISEAFSRKLFGSDEALGQLIKLENGDEVQITGIFKDLPHSTYLRFELIVSYTTFYNSRNSEIWWYGGHVYTYIKTRPGFKPIEVYGNWDSFFKKYMKATFDRLNGTAHIILQPIRELYLSPEFIWEPYPHGSKDNIRIFSVIAIFLLLVAGFNYTNLSLSHSLYRKEEISIRKILGAKKIHIFKQGLLEAFVLSLFVALFSVSLLSTLFPLYATLTGRIAPSFVTEPWMILVVFSMSISLTLLAALYPSIRIAILNISLFQESGMKLSFRKLFVTSQQVIAVVLIICASIVISQIRFIKNLDLGYNNENLVVIQLRDWNIKRNLDAFQESVSQITGVLKTSRVDETPKSGPNEFTYLMQNKTGEFVSNPSQTLEVGLNFLQTLDLELLSGRHFKETDDEYTGVIINEFLCKKMGYEPREALGVKIKFGEDDENERSVIGVVNDFKLGSVHEVDQAMTLGYRKRSSSNMLVKLQRKNQQETLNKIQSTWIKHGGELPFQFSYFKDEYEGLLFKENRLLQLLIIGTILILLISCLGLLGIVAHTSMQRTKEIGIRKVMGANGSQLYFLLLHEFLKTHFLAFIIGSALAWYIGNSWLENYPQRIDVSISFFVTAGVVSLTIVILTISVHALQLIKSNPVNSLRDE